jgi:hypothetical protein
MEGRSGPVALTATAPAFSGATGSMIVVTPTIEVIGVPTTTTTLSADIPFRVHVGLPPAGGSVFDEEPVRPGGTAITATVANTSGLVGQLRTSAGAAQTVTRTIGVGESGTPGTVAAGGLAFDPLGSGTTLVSVSAPGLNAAQGTSVTVSAPALTVYTAGARVGSGLRSAGTYTVQLGAPAPAGGLAVTLASSNGAVLRVSDAGATSVGAASAVLTVPQGQTQASFYIHGVEGQTGSATVTASAPGFTNGTGSVTELPPSIDISGLATSTHVTSADEPFQVRVGVPNQYNGTLDEQPVRPGSAPIVATVTNAGATVARLVTGALAGQAVTVAIPAGQTRSAATVAAGGVAFHPLAAGSTTVSASAPGAIAHPGATVPVTVIP